MEKPVISTSIGAEGLPVRDGAELLLADTPEAFAKSVVAVLTDQVLARRLGQQAAAEVRNRFGWGRVAEAFGAICNRALTMGREFSEPALPVDGKIESAI
jgi:glycosyltransferase involved in cell wall biosynthesis